MNRPTRPGAETFRVCLGLCLAVASVALGSSDVDSSQPRELPRIPLAVLDSYREETARLAFEAPGIVLRTPRLNVAGGELELAERISSIVETAANSLPDELYDAGLRIRVDIERPKSGRCPIRAWASVQAGYGFITVHVDTRWSPSTLSRVVAHEVGHIYHHAATENREGPHGDALLSEGLATWLARDPWLSDLEFESFADAVRSYLGAGAYVGLAEEYELDISGLVDSAEECFAKRDQLYTQWAGFVEFLLQEYGLEMVVAATEQARTLKVDSLGMMTLERLDYEVAFGASLTELEQRWHGGLGG